jgi:hypothetical protein
MLAGFSAAVIWETLQLSTMGEETAISAPVIGLLALSWRIERPVTNLKLGNLMGVTREIGIEWEFQRERNHRTGHY